MSGRALDPLERHFAMRVRMQIGATRTSRFCRQSILPSSFNDVLDCEPRRRQLMRRREFITRAP